MRKGYLITLLVLFLPSSGTVSFTAPVPEIEKSIIAPVEQYYEFLSEEIPTPVPQPVPDKTVEVEEQPVEELENIEAAVASMPEKTVVYPYPEHILVRITGTQECEAGPYRIVKVPFKKYVKIVLANEWGRDWNEESLKAGAVSVKMYAWYAVETGGKWGVGDVYDCDWDMVYNPSIRFDTTDQAVIDTWDYYLLDSKGDLFMPHFLAWYGACLGWLGDTGKCLGQWNSLADAENGMTWTEILEKYYRDTKLVELKGR